MDRDPVEPTFQFIYFFSSSLRHPAPGTRIESSMFLPLFIIVNRLSVVCGCGGWLVRGFFLSHTYTKVHRLVLLLAQRALISHRPKFSQSKGTFNSFGYSFCAYLFNLEEEK